MNNALKSVGCSSFKKIKHYNLYVLFPDVCIDDKHAANCFGLTLFLLNSKNNVGHVQALINFSRFGDYDSVTKNFCKLVFAMSVVQKQCSFISSDFKIASIRLLFLWLFIQLDELILDPNPSENVLMILLTPENSKPFLLDGTWSPLYT